MDIHDIEEIAEFEFETTSQAPSEGPLGRSAH